MDKYPRDDRYSHSPSGNSPRKMRKVEFQQNVQQQQAQQSVSTSASDAAMLSDVPKCSTTAINSKMSNLKKLRQQFVNEIKSVEATLKENIKGLKSKIAAIDKEAETYIEKLKKANKHLCNQSEILYAKEQENKVLKEHIEELYEYQKIIFENLEDITNTQTTSDDLTIQLKNHYDSVLITQENDLKTLEDEFQKLTPDKHLCEALEKLELINAEKDQEFDHYEKEIKKLQMELMAKRKQKEEQQAKIKEINDKIKELETHNEMLIQNGNKEKSKLTEEIEVLKQVISTEDEKVKNLGQQISDARNKLEASKNKEKEIENRIKEINDEKELLLKESEELDKTLKKDDEENQLNLEQIRDKLKVVKVELTTEKQKQENIISILHKKIADLKQKLNNYDILVSKLKRYELDLKKEKELSNVISNQLETKKKDYYDSKIQAITEKTSKIKLELEQKEEQFYKSEQKVKHLKNELNQLTEKYESDLKMSQAQAKKVSPVNNFSQYSLPKLFSSEQSESPGTPRSVRKLYTVTLSEDDMEIDDLPVDEQYTELTKSNQAEIPNKSRKFFKRTSLSQPSLSQPSPKKEATPRGKGRGRK